MATQFLNYLVEKKIKITREMEVWLWKNRINLSSFVQAKIKEEMEKERSKQSASEAKAE